MADDVEELRGLLPFLEDIESIETFRHFGHTMSTRTMIKGLYEVEAGTILTLREEPEPAAYVSLSPPERVFQDQESYSRHLRSGIEAVTTRLLMSVGARQLVVPISAGYDSRLILTALRQAGATNVITYSYGVSGSPQKEISQRVAEALGYPFHFVEYDVKRVRSAWNETEEKEYLRKAWGATSLPFRQDWFAIRELTRRGVVGEGAVVLPGHSIPIALAPEAAFTDEPLSAADVGNDIARAIGNIQGKPKRAASSRRFREGLALAARETGFGSENQDALRLWQWFNLKTRQAKFISNSVRVYEHFGLQWALLLHEPEIWDARLAGSKELLRDRAGYKEFVDRFYGEIAGESTPTALRTTVPEPTARRSRPKPAFVSAIGRSAITRNAVRRVGALKRDLSPPRSSFALEAFREDRSRLGTFVDSMQGVRGNGLTVSLFLKDARRVVPPLFESRGWVSLRRFAPRSQR